MKDIVLMRVFFYVTFNAQHMKHLINLATPKAKDTLSLEDICKNVKETIMDFMSVNKMAPDIIKVIITCTYLQFSDFVKRAFYGSVDAIYAVSEEKFAFYLPTLDIKLRIILDPLPDKGQMKARTICENSLVPNIVPDTGATETNINYQSIEPYFNKERLHFIAREYNPETNEMTIRWQFNGKTKMSSVATFKVSISNAGLRFQENHASEYIVSGNDDNIIIRGADAPEATGMAGNVLHIDGVDSPNTLLDVRYNYGKGFWEYRICSDNTTIRGEACYASDNYKPLDDSLTVTVEGIGLYLEPLGKPRARK